MSYNDLISKSRFFNKENLQQEKPLNIGIISPHFFPLGWPTHGGSDLIIDLANALDDMGHTVNLYTPACDYCPKYGKIYPMRCSYGQSEVSSEECEQACYDRHKESLYQQDIIHDFSITKRIAENMFNEGKRNIVSTALGGVWRHPNPTYNLICQSHAMRDRALRGATDYENSPTPNAAGPPMKPVKEAHVVHNGIDTDFYCPAKNAKGEFTYEKKDYLLWLNRWHTVKGFGLAIEVARNTGLKLIMAGEDFDAEWSDYQRKAALYAVELAKGIPNIEFRWLPFGAKHNEAKIKLYREARAFLYPTVFNEPFGLSQVEVGACGTPVIGSNFGSVPEVIQDGITGLVVKYGTEAFIDALDKIDKIDPKRCREEAVKRFDRSVMAKNYLKEYYSVINGDFWGI